MTKLEEMDRVFTYLAPNESQIICVQNLRNHGKILAKHICNDCPDSNEKEIALEKLREAIMWANAALALNWK